MQNDKNPAIILYIKDNKLVKYGYLPNITKFQIAMMNASKKEAISLLNKNEIIIPAIKNNPEAKLSDIIKLLAKATYTFLTCSFIIHINEEPNIKLDKLSRNTIRKLL